MFQWCEFEASQYRSKVIIISSIIPLILVIKQPITNIASWGFFESSIKDTWFSDLNQSNFLDKFD